MTSDDLAELLVPHFNTIDWEDLEEFDFDEAPVEFEATKPEDEIVIDLERANWGVYLWPAGETETAIDRGDMCREELLVHVYVHGPLTGDFGRKHALEFVRALRYSLRETTFGGYRWETNETVDGIFDPAVLRQKTQFLTVFQATYFAFN